MKIDRRQGIKQFVHRLYYIVGRRNTSKFALLFIAVLLMAASQVIGVASMLPFLKLVTDPGIIESNDMVHVVYEISGAKDYHMFMIVAGVVVLLLITLSSVLTVFTFALQYKVVQQTAYDIERRILINYMQKDYI